MKSKYFKAGFTLIDLVVGLAISSVVILISMTFINQTMGTMSLIKEKTRINSKFTMLYGFIHQQKQSSDLLIKQYDNYFFIKENSINGHLNISETQMIINEMDTFKLAPNTFKETLVPLKDELYFVKTIESKIQINTIESSFYINYDLLNNSMLCDTNLIYEAVNNTVKN